MNIGLIIQKIAKAMQKEGILPVVLKIVRIVVLSIKSFLHHNFNLIKLFIIIRWHRSRRALGIQAQSIYKGKGLGTYCVDDIVEVGYAIRSITMLTAPDKNNYLVTADVGDDTLSVIPMEHGKFKKRNVLKLPAKSAPIGVMSVNPDPERVSSDGLFFTLFNFDDTEKILNETSVHMIAETGDIVKALRENIPDITRHPTCNKILSRKGHWGFRCVNCFRGEDEKNHLVFLDRDEDLVYIAEIPFGSLNLSEGTLKKLSLRQGDVAAEPIYVAILPPNDISPAPSFLISQRANTELSVISKGASGEYEVTDRVDIGGASRSSVAVGCFRSPDKTEAAISLWGGDPKDLNSIHYGKVSIISADPDGKFAPPLFIDAGVHPTDAVAGDFDGDGIDELAILNYGSGLYPSDRIHPGSLQIFKYIDGGFRNISTIHLPHPRIGYSADIDNDGKQELIVSLFFEKRLAVIKHY